MDRIRDKVSTATCQTSTLEDVDDVIHHHVHAGQLGPHLEGAAESNTTPDTSFEQVGIGLGALAAFEVHLLLDFLEFETNEVIVAVSLAVEICEDLECFVLTNNVI